MDLVTPVVWAFAGNTLIDCFSIRNGPEWRSNRVILNKEVISPKMLGNFVPLLDDVGHDFVARVHKKIERSGQNKWTTDLSQELFKYALECETGTIESLL